MKQKIVIQLSINGEKPRSKSKAMQIAVAASGVESVSFKDDKSQIEVTGDGLDATVLTQLLRKKMGHADLLSVGPAGGEKKDDKPKENEANIQVAWPYNALPYICYNAMPYEVHAARDPSICSIM